MIEGTEIVKKNIGDIYNRKLRDTYSLCLWYGARAQETFRKVQTFNLFWNNQTATAYKGVFWKAFQDKSSIGFFLAHAVDYGVYLELANDRKHEALWPIVQELFPEFDKALKEIWA